MPARNHKRGGVIALGSKKGGALKNSRSGAGGGQEDSRGHGIKETTHPSNVVAAVRRSPVSPTSREQKNRRAGEFWEIASNTPAQQYKDAEKARAKVARGDYRE